MQIQVVGDDVEITERVRHLIEERLGLKVDKHLRSFEEDVKQATVRVKEHSRYGYVVSLSMYLPKKEQIFAEEHAEDLISAVVAVRKQVIRQIKEYKAELRGKKHQRKTYASAMVEE